MQLRVVHCTDLDIQDHVWGMMFLDFCFYDRLRYTRCEQSHDNEDALHGLSQGRGGLHRIDKAAKLKSTDGSQFLVTSLALITPPNIQRYLVYDRISLSSHRSDTTTYLPM